VITSTSVPPPPSPQRAVAVFLAAGLVVLAAVGVLLGLVQHSQAEEEAVRHARDVTQVQAGFVARGLQDTALLPGPDWLALDEVIDEHVLGGQVVRVKIWDRDGRIVYSDDPDLIGEVFALSPSELELFDSGAEPVAEVSDLDEDENRKQRVLGERLMQVYVGISTEQGTPLLFEAYREYDAISAASRERTLSFLPVLVGGLALLWLAQAPLAWRMATRLRAAHDEREQLLVAALAASDRERQRLAADLHDGVVQGLSGASYTLTAEAARVSAAGQRGVGDALHGVAIDLRRCVRELRSLIVTITPPGLRRQPLLASLKDLVAPLEDRGVQVTVEVCDDSDVDQPMVELVLRTAQEAVRNILRHAAAQSVDVVLRREQDDLRLTVSDDGRGFPTDRRPGRRDSMGLDLLRGLARTEGGRIEVRSAPGSGTELELVVPCRAREPVFA
jgi:signal transduction histidine kinase